MRKSIPGMTIATGLSGFSLLARITESTKERVAALADLADAPQFIGLEALAQAGAYHVRFLCEFERQAVLLMIRNGRLPEEEMLNGRYEISGTLRSRSASVFAYEMSAVKSGKAVIEGEFVFAAVAYDSNLREEILKKHYEKKWADLRNG
ncbi:MAG: hypothetical protein A4E74_00969 [Syntrophus sp. PtaB.Bin075]|nr:MAG: hypothetical protein A4E74_00969 [Syntrophus sp. PtaB.Bin075]